MPQSRRHRNRQTPEQQSRSRRKHIIWLSLLVLIVYASALGGDFVWSDREDLLQGEYRITSLADLGLALSASDEAYRLRDSRGAGAPSVGSWQPLTIISNSLSWALWRDCAFCFHLENILLHALVVIGLYALGRHLLSRRRHGNRVAAWAAAVYAVHPATVPSVAWIGGRNYLLAALFSVWSLVIFTRLQATTKSHQGHVNRWLGILALGTLAAMLADGMAYMLPLVALLVAAYESGERGRTALKGISPVRLRALILVVAVLVLLLIYRSLMLGGLGLGENHPSISEFKNIGTALRHFWGLVELAMLPSEPIISDAWRITLRWGTGEVAALLGLLLVVAATLTGLRFRHPAAFGTAWFLLWLVPGVGIFPGDHYHNSQAVYLALWGLVFALVFALFRLWRPVGRQLMPGSEAVVFVPLILVLGVITGFSNARWWSHTGLFESEIASDPHYIEGRVELAKVALERQQPAAALNHMLAAIEASNDTQYAGYWPASQGYRLLGQAQWELELYEDAKGSFHAALEAAPGDARSLHWLGVAQLSTQDFGAAESSFRQALDARPAFADAEADLGVALAAQDRFVEAHPLLAQAIQRGLGNPRRYKALARTMIDAGDYEGAAQQLSLSLALREEPTERARLAWVSWKLGRGEQARGHLDMALQSEEQTSEYVEWVRVQLQQTP